MPTDEHRLTVLSHAIRNALNETRGLNDAECDWDSAVTLAEEVLERFEADNAPY